MLLDGQLCGCCGGRSMERWRGRRVRQMSREARQLGRACWSICRSLTSRRVRLVANTYTHITHTRETDRPIDRQTDRARAGCEVFTKKMA